MSERRDTRKAPGKCIGFYELINVESNIQRPLGMCPHRKRFHSLSVSLLRYGSFEENLTPEKTAQMPFARTPRGVEYRHPRGGLVNPNSVEILG
jgi:hypothetical protein